MPLSPLEYLRHIKDEADYLVEQAEQIDKSAFVHSETLKRAFVRSVEIIGEASRKRPVEMRELYPHIQWREMSAMRDHLVHGYFGVDYDIVWDVVQNKIPHLRQAVIEILANSTTPD